MPYRRRFACTASRLNMALSRPKSIVATPPMNRSPASSTSAMSTMVSGAAIFARISDGRLDEVFELLDTVSFREQLKA